MTPNFSSVFVGHGTDWITGGEEGTQWSLIVEEVMRNIIIFLLYFIIYVPNKTMMTVIGQQLAQMSTCSCLSGSCS